MNDTIEIFPGKSLADLFKEVYNTSKSKSTQIQELITTLQNMISSINDATILVPMIKEYLDVSVKNDDQLLKIAQIVQRLTSAKAVAGAGELATLLTDEEKNQLLKEVEEVMLENEEKVPELPPGTIKQLPTPETPEAK